MLVFAIVVAVLSGWCAAGIVVAVLFGQAARSAENLSSLLTVSTTEREVLLRHLAAASGQAQARNLAVLERATRNDPDAEFRSMLAAQANMNQADEHGHVPVGMD